MLYCYLDSFEFYGLCDLCLVLPSPKFYIKTFRNRSNAKHSTCANEVSYTNLYHDSGSMSIDVDVARDDNGSAGHGSRVKWVINIGWVMWVTGQSS